jgi:ribosomal protein S18 acetylase RimI-like enzyme
MDEKPKPARRRFRTAAVVVDIRQMQLKDISAVFDLGQRLFTAEQLPTLYRSWDEHEIVALFDADEETCLVAEAGGQVVGFALGRIMDKPRNAWRYGWLEWRESNPGSSAAAWPGGS